MPKILVAYHSETGNTESMAELVAEGVREAGADVDLMSVEQVAVDDLPGYDGYIIGSPTYYGLL